MNATKTKMLGWTWALACAGLLAACDTSEEGGGEGGSGGGGGGEENDLGVGGGAGGGLSGGTPAGGAPSGGAPAGGEPSGGTPAGGEPSGGIPAGGEPAGGAPAGGEAPPQCTLDVECPQPGAPNCSGVCLDGVCDIQCEEPPPQCDEERACPPNAVCRDGVCVPVEPCVCPEIFAPVCGADGQTYGNACEAECAGVEIVAMGECGAGVCPDPNDPAVTYVSDDPEMCQVILFRCEPGQEAFSNECGCGCIDAPVCICPAVFAPVCGEDGQTYGNACEAECAAVPVAYDGECVEVPCVCAAVFAPVCGEDGQTYGNACEAECAAVPVAYDGECRNEGCICPAVVAPVCGEDGRTYGNACEAACVMVPVAYDGECQGAGACPDPNDPRVSYVGDSPEQCAAIDFLCAEGAEYFFSDCGCGCILPPPVEECICPRIFAPVCGENGQTYANECLAACVRVAVAYDGECRAVDPACPDPNDPNVRYVAETPEQCQVVRFFCEADEELFSNECGCGCVRIPQRACAEGEIRTPEGECRAACRGDQECRRGTVCNAAEVCLNDPNCPMCDVCAGWCVAAVQ
ncbi:MAG: Kazal-type serine protease inhibitor domain-containing protein [Bradymonadia bacterium]